MNKNETVMNKVFYLISFILLFATGCGGKDDDLEIDNNDTAETISEANEKIDVTRGINLTDEQKVMVSMNNDFSFKLYRFLSQSDAFRGKSLFVSPISCTYVLGMLNDGAKGQTCNEIEKLLGFSNSSAKDVNELCQTLILEAPLVDDRVTLKLANTVIANQQIDLLDTYMKDMKNYYSAEIFSKDFSQASTLNFINNWCNEHTEGLIPRILDFIDSNMCAVLMNAIYFKAEWSGKFKKEETAEDTFTKEDGNKAVLPIMHRLDAASYTRNELYSTIGLPYGKGNRWNMYVLLPGVGKTVADILNSLTQESWSENKKRMIGTQVDVRLPRFRAEFEVNLTDGLQRLGGITMFSPSADYSAITTSQNFSVSMVKQKAIADITEEGTETSAVTVVGIESDNGENDVSSIIQFHAIRPFVYLIQEETSGVIFFIGTYAG